MIRQRMGLKKRKLERKNPLRAPPAICNFVCKHPQGPPALHPLCRPAVFPGFPLWGRTAANSGLWLVFVSRWQPASLTLSASLVQSFWPQPCHTPRPPPRFCMSPSFPAYPIEPYGAYGLIWASWGAAQPTSQPASPVERRVKMSVSVFFSAEEGQHEPPKPPAPARLPASKRRLKRDFFVGRHCHAVSALSR